MSNRPTPNTKPTATVAAVDPAKVALDAIIAAANVENVEPLALTATVHAIIRPEPAKVRTAITNGIMSRGVECGPLFAAVAAAIASAPAVGSADPKAVALDIVTAAVLDAAAKVHAAVTGGFLDVETASEWLPLFGFVAAADPSSLAEKVRTSSGSGSRRSPRNLAPKVGTYVAKLSDGSTASVAVAAVADGWTWTVGTGGAKGKVFTSPSAAAVAVKRSALKLPTLALTKDDSRGAENGWTFWRLSTLDGSTAESVATEVPKV